MISEFSPELFVAIAQTLDPSSCVALTESCVAAHSAAREIEQDLLLRNPEVISSALAHYAEIPETLDYDLDRVVGRLKELKLASPLTQDSAWLEALLLRSTKVRTLWLSSAPQITKEAICRIGNFRFITALHLKQHPTVDNETLNAFSGLPLEKLHLESLDRVVGHECVDTAILTHTRLCSLSLVSIPEFHDAALAKLTRLTNLTSLGCDCRDVVDVGFSDVARMTKLVSLEVLTQESLTDDLVEPLRNHPSMQRLVLSHSLLLSSISAPASIRTLRVLDLTRCSSIRDDEFEPLRDHPTLVTIRASNCHEVTRHACEVFATIAGLKELYINGCSKLEDSDLEWFGANNSLRVLDLSKTRIDGSGLQWLARIRTLEELVLNSVRLLQPGVINVFSGHESLAVVSLTGTRLLSGREVKSLLRCPKIKKVLTNAEHAQLLADRYPRRLVLL